MNDKSCWLIPLTWTTSKELNFDDTYAKDWLNCDNNNYTIDSIFYDEWIIFNIQITGKFYHTKI